MHAQRTDTTTTFSRPAERIQVVSEQQIDPDHIRPHHHPLQARDAVVYTQGQKWRGGDNDDGDDGDQRAIILGGGCFLSSFL